MRRLRRKILVAITAFGMIFGSVSSAFAASYSDVKPDSDIAGSVNRLSALGVLTGYPDGSFKPENPITRAEFAAVALRALGAEAGAEAAKGATRFSDVGADHWASGYINLAVQLGLLTGYPDGTFKPDQQVTFAESLAILVRALGYDSQVRGTWPENYLAMGSSLGLARGVTISGNAPANRGQVAVMTDNALGVKLANSNQTLVERLGVKVWDQSGFRVIANARLDKGLDPDEVKIEYEGDNDDVKDEFGTETFRLVGYNPQSLLGHEIAFWTRGNDIIYVQDRTRASDVKVGVFSLTNVDATNKTATFHVDFGYDKDDDFSLAPNTRGDADEDPVLYLNHERVTLATFLNSNPRGDGVVIVD
ncbi:MAG: S-layer homology domain-containing protein, partial [Clostridia bacterium]|nr:S-layer homology domain-containing protein [Clostridia bacterium]